MLPRFAVRHFLKPLLPAAFPVLLLTSGCPDAPAQTITSSTAAALPETTATTRNRLSPAEVQQMIARAEKQPAVAEEARQRQLEFLRQALEQLQQADQWTTRAEEAARAQAEAPAEIDRLRQELAQNLPEVQPAPPPGASLAQLEQLAAGPRQELEEAQRRERELRSELRQRSERSAEIPRLVAAAREALEQLRVEQQAGPLPDEPAEVTEARMVLNRARRQALWRELQAHEKEMQSYEARSELLTLRREAVSGKVAQLERLVKGWQEVLTEQRRRDAAEAASAARRQRLAAAGAHPVLEKLTDENAAFAEERAAGGLGEKIDRLTRELEQTDQALKRLRDQERGLRSKVEAVGLSDVIGVLLRKQRDELASLRERLPAAGERKKEIAAAHLRLLEIEDELAALRDFPGAVHRTLAAIPVGETTGSQRAATEALVRDLLQARRDFLQALARDYNSYFSKLVEADTLEKQLLQEADDLTSFVEERILWIPSGSVLSLDPHKLHQSLLWITSGTQWERAWSAIRADFLQYFGLYALAALVAGMLLYFRSGLWESLADNCQTAGRSSSVSPGSAARAVLVTLLLSATFPWIGWFLGWRLSSSGTGSSFALALGSGLTAAASIHLGLAAVRNGCTEKGLGILCFGWPASPLRMLRRNLLWLMALVLPIRVLLEPAHVRGVDVYDGGLARVLFISAMAACALFLYRVLRPRGGILTGVLIRNPGGWMSRLQAVWHWTAVAIPLALAGASFVGYHDTAVHLGGRLLDSVWLGVAFVVLESLLLHWLTLGRRRLALEELRRRRQTMKDAEGGDIPPAPEKPPVAASTVHVQANRFTHSLLLFAFLLGLWLIWRDVTPALGILRNVELWAHQVRTTEIVRTAEGAQTFRTVDRVEPVTLAHALLASLFLLMTYIAARNLPGVVEISVLRRFRFDEGARYAVTTLARYLIVLGGGVLALRTLGVGWTNVQWLAAAVTVGLGFGLQEIFANFISGLILLLERPIRVGDMISVNGVLGKVTRIQIRATTMMDMDRKELITPNKTFITGQVINYTLSDTVARLTITVRIPAGSDYDAARETLLRIASSHPLVLKEPPPVAALSELKNDGAELQLFVHLPDLNNSISVRHDLLIAADREFRTNGTIPAGS